MANFNFYLNRQGVRGRQGIKGDKGDTGYSPYIDIKTDTPTEFIMTIHNETEDFDTPNLIPTAVGEKVVELEGSLNELSTKVEQNTQEIENTNIVVDNNTDGISKLNTSVIELQARTTAVEGKANQNATDITYKQNKLVAGDNITLTENSDRTVTISAEGGGGTGDVTADGDNTFTGGNTFEGKSFASELQGNGGTINFSMKNMPRGEILGTGSIGLDGLGDLTLDASSHLYINGQYIAVGDFDKTSQLGIITKATSLNMSAYGLWITLPQDGKLTVSRDNGISSHKILTDNMIKAGDNVTVDVDSSTGDVTISSTGGGSSTPSELDKYIEGSTNDNTTTISTKDGKALELSAPTIAVGNNLVNEINGTDTQLYLKQGDITAGDNITVEKTATGVKVSAATTDISGLESDVSTLQTNTAALSANVASLRTDVDKKQNTLKAGDNITLVNNSDGTTTISSSGGSGGSGGDVYTNKVNTFTEQNNFKKRTYFGSNDSLSINNNTFYFSTSEYESTEANIISINKYHSNNEDDDATRLQDTLVFDMGQIYSDIYLTEGVPTPYVHASQFNEMSGTYQYFNETLLTKEKLIVTDGLNKTEGNYEARLSLKPATTTSLGGVKPDGTTITVNSNGVISAVGGGSSTEEKYGIQGDYATRHGIIDNPNGIIEFSSTSKEIKVKQGLVLNCAGNGTAKTTISADIAHTVESTGSFTLFYAGGDLLECGKVDYSTTEPTDNGVDNYQAWFNPDESVNTDKQWQFKSNNTGNVWRYVNSATPIADIVANGEGITSASYLGYRVTDDDIYAHQSSIQELNDKIDAVDLSGVATLSGSNTFVGANNFSGGYPLTLAGSQLIFRDRSSNTLWGFVGNDSSKVDSFLIQGRNSYNGISMRSDSSTGLYSFLGTQASLYLGSNQGSPYIEGTTSSTLILHPTQGTLYNSKLTIGKDKLIYTKEDSTEVDLLAGGSSGGGDVTLAGDNIFTGTNSFDQGRIYLDEYQEENIGLNDAKTSFNIITYADELNFYDGQSISNALIFNKSDGTIRFKSTDGTPSGTKSEFFLKTSDIVAGDSITLTKNVSDGTLTISAPNAVTTDTEQTITANKVIQGGTLLVQKTSIPSGVKLESTGTTGIITLGHKSDAAVTCATIEAGNNTSGTVKITTSTLAGQGGVTINDSKVITESDAEFIAHQAMPSSTVTSLTLGATGSEYIVPSDGYMSLYMRGGTAGQFFYMSNSNGVGSRMVASGTGAVKSSIPCSKGDTITISYNLPTEDARLYFTPTIGANSNSAA